MHNTQKKQNRILLVTLIVILASASILIAITGGANRKKPSENPPLDNATEAPSDQSGKEPETDRIDSTIKPERLPFETKGGNESSPDDEKTDAPAESDNTDQEVSSILDKTLPKFKAPIDSVVIKDYSDDIPVFSYTMNDYRTHSGLDFACSVGTPVLAAADGVICELKDDPMMGATVAIQHSGGAITKYKGLSPDSLDLKKIGDDVKLGDVIGASGDTALIESAEEAHLHFELTIEGEPADPAEYMDVSFLSELYED